MSTHCGWTHEAAFEALWTKYSGRRTKAGAYAFLYPQRPNSAVLYQDDAPNSGVRRGPLHLRPESPSARPTMFHALEACMELVRSENRDSKPSGFDWYKVHDWNTFARVVGLPPSPS